MRYIDEFRNPQAAKQLVAQIYQRARHPIRLMEFCGGHTHAIMRSGLRQLMPENVRLLSGPGCPVCVTAGNDVDRAIALALVPGVILATFGDMVRVPGTGALRQLGGIASLQEASAQGADVRIVYSTLDALALAGDNPHRSVVFLGVGFETTAPTVAAAVLQAQAAGLRNFLVLSLHKLTPPATKAILDAGEVGLSGIIGPGHVTTIIGSDAWQFLPRDYAMPCAIAGFEPLDILEAIYALVEMNESGKAAVHNGYGRSVKPVGNRTAQEIMGRVFRGVPAEWRGLGVIPASGLALREEYESFDALRLAREQAWWGFYEKAGPSPEPPGCRCGQILRGVAEPAQCPLFGRGCTPDHPVGPCMVSSEGACAAHIQYGKI